MHADGARGPHLAVAAPFGAEQSVERPVGVGNDVEGQMKVLPVRGETLRDCEGDDRDPGVTELIKVIAHGDHVLLAGQSSQMSVQDQHEGPAAHLRGTPRPTLVIDEFHFREWVTDVESQALSPACAPRWSHHRRVGCATPFAW